MTADFKSEECLKNPAIISTLVKKLPLSVTGGGKQYTPDAPHTNGAIEVMVQMEKKAIQVSTGDTSLSFTELQTLSISQIRGNEDLKLI